MDADESGGALVGDFKVCGFWQSQVDCILEVRVVDTDAPSHVNRPVREVLASAESEKKRSILMRSSLEEVLSLLLCFWLMVFWVKRRRRFVKHLANTLAIKSTLSFSTIRATD